MIRNQRKRISGFVDIDFTFEREYVIINTEKKR